MYYNVDISISFKLSLLSVDVESDDDVVLCNRTPVFHFAISGFLLKSLDSIENPLISVVEQLLSVIVFGETLVLSFELVDVNKETLDEDGVIENFLCL